MSRKVHLTRTKTEVPLIGQPQDINGIVVLPTNMDVMRAFEWRRLEMKSEGISNPAKKDIAIRVAKDVQGIWQRASIPTTGTQNIFMMLKLHERCEKLKKSSGTKTPRANPETYKDKVKIFTREVLDKLFDICACKCKMECKCPPEKRVPIEERSFLEDQRTERQMIGGCDVTESRKLQKRTERKTKRMSRRVDEDFRSKFPRLAGVAETDSDVVSSSSVPGGVSSESEFEPSTSFTSATKHKSSAINIDQKLPKTLPTFARALDRRGLSNRAGAQIASTLLADIGVITADNKSAVVDKSKVRRERSKSRRSTSATRTSDLIALYFDGRKDQTITKQIVDGKAVRVSIVEEHISMVEEPGSKYLGHVTPHGGSGANIVKSMRDFAKTKAINISSMSFNCSIVKAIGCDGTSTNTGHLKGAVRIMEQALQKPLQVIVCLLHLNELPLRKLMVKLDGKTTDPKGFSGPVGKQLANCENLPVVKYDRIDAAQLPEVQLSDLSTDQMYLREIWLAVTSGNCPENLARKNPENLSHSRWLTLASRVLRLYVATENPTQELLHLTEFVVKVYVPTWFTIKCQPYISHASKHFFGIIDRSRYLDDDLKTIVHASLQTNGYMAHPEHILLGMLFDPRPVIRQLAIKRILKARENENETVRSFVPPRINFEAKEYTDLIDWQTTPVTVPPLIADFTIEQLNDNARTGQSDSKEFQLPSHTQAVERVVKKVTEEREGFIRATLMDRTALPEFDTK